MVKSAEKKLVVKCLYLFIFCYRYLLGVFYGIRLRIRRPQVRILPGVPRNIKRGRTDAHTPFPFENATIRACG